MQPPTKIVLMGVIIYPLAILLKTPSAIIPNPNAKNNGRNIQPPEQPK